MRSGGFTLVELLIAMTITLLLAGALAGVTQPARDSFERVPAELELQQRARTAIEAMSQALRASLIVPTGAGVFDELTVIAPVTGAARGVLSIDQPGAGAVITLGTALCPNITDVCGFTAGATALIEDEEGVYDVFTVASTDADARRITPAGALSQSYADGADVVEVEQFTFRLTEQPDGTRSLIRKTAAGAIQPIVDFVSELSFNVAPGQVDVSIALDPSSEVLRALTTARTFHASIKSRNLP